jgi:hypothetical protein
MFGHKDLEPGEAVIVERHVKHHGNDGRNTLFEWLADVTPANGVPFRAVLATPGLALDFREPGPGDHVSVLIDRKKDITHFDKSDPRISLKAERAEQDRSFAESSASSFGSPAPVAPDSAARPQNTTYVDTQVVSATDAAPFLQAILSGDSGAREQAISELRAQQQPAPSDVGERLSRLESLKAAGTLSEVEYQAQRQRIVDSI